MKLNLSRKTILTHTNRLSFFFLNKDILFWNFISIGSSISKIFTYYSYLLIIYEGKIYFFSIHLLKIVLIFICTYLIWFCPKIIITFFPPEIILLYYTAYEFVFFIPFGEIKKSLQRFSNCLISHVRGGASLIFFIFKL